MELDNVTAESNAYYDGAVIMIDSVDVTKINCTFRNNAGTALFLVGSILTFSGHNEIIGL